MQAGAGPHLMLINPGKRKRFYVMEEDLSDEHMSIYIYNILGSVFDKLASGDIKFKNFKANTIPELE